MSKQPETRTDAILNIWMGARCTEIVKWDYSWRFNFGDSGGVTVECPWRILADGRIALSNADHGQQFGLPAPVDAEADARSLILNRTIRAVTASDITADMKIEFEGNRILELTNNSSGYEAWQASVSNEHQNTMLIAMGGAEIAIFL